MMFLTQGEELESATDRVNLVLPHELSRLKDTSGNELLDHGRFASVELG